MQPEKLIPEEKVLASSMYSTEKKDLKQFQSQLKQNR